MKTKILILTLALGASTCLLNAQDGGQRPEGQRPPGRDGGLGGPGGPRMPSPIMEALDLNKDGTIDADELAKAGESLKKLDKNGDGKSRRTNIARSAPAVPAALAAKDGAAGPVARVVRAVKAVRSAPPWSSNHLHVAVRSSAQGRPAVDSTAVALQHHLHVSIPMAKRSASDRLADWVAAGRL